MNKYRKNEIQVGVVTFAGIILIFALLFFVRGFNFMNKEKNILFEFENSAGINAGSPLVIQGVQCGSVSNVWNEHNKVKISANIDDNIDLREDVFAKISILEITGGKKIEIFPGTSSKKFDYNNVIPGKSAADLSSMITTISEVSGNLTSIILKLDETISSINTLVKDKNLISNVSDIVSNSSKLTSDLSCLISENKREINCIVDKTDNVLSQLNSLTEENKTDINNIISEVKLASSKLNNTIENADKTFLVANNLLENANSILDNINSNRNNTISKLIYDQNFSQKLDSIVFNLDSLVKQVQQYGLNANIRLGGRP